MFCWYVVHVVSVPDLGVLKKHISNDSKVTVSYYNEMVCKINSSKTSTLDNFGYMVDG